jgi:hypothetical protein
MRFSIRARWDGAQVPESAGAGASGLTLAPIEDPGWTSELAATPAAVRAEAVWDEHDRREHE